MIHSSPLYARDPGRVRRLAVIYGRELYVIEHTNPAERLPIISSALVVDPQSPGAPMGEMTLEAIIAYCLDMRCGALWLLPVDLSAPVSAAGDCELMCSWPQDIPADSESYVSHPLSSDAFTCGLVVQARATDGRGVGIPFGIYAPWVNDCWGIAAAMRELAVVRSPAGRACLFVHALALAAYQLGQQLRFSPSYTGLAMMRAELASWEIRNHTELAPLSAEWREKLQGELLPSYFLWSRPLTIPQFSGYFTRSAGGLPVDLIPCWQYDRNMSFVSSARVIPVGDPVPTDEYVPGVPGVYRLEGWSPVGGSLGKYASLMPGPFRVGAGEGEYPAEYRTAGQVWAWEPQIRAAIARGWAVLFAGEGYCWPDGRSHDLLRRWQEQIWSARKCAQLYPIWGAIAEALIKKIGVAAIGRLNQREGTAMVPTGEARSRGLLVRAYETDDYGELTGNVSVHAQLGREDMVWPHVWATIIGNANERLWSTVVDHAPDVTPLCYVDALWTTEAIAGLAGPETAPGKFKAAGLFGIPVAEAGALVGMGPAAAVKLYASWARRYPLEPTDPDTITF